MEMLVLWLRAGMAGIGEESLSRGTHIGDGSQGSGRFHSGIMWLFFLRCAIDGSYTASLKMILATGNKNLFSFFHFDPLTFFLLFIPLVSS